MRPLRIEVEGFSAYRQRVDVDFADVDFFSLAGPTGSGKSSLIDAMVFALFGRVPRLGGKAVAPAITAGTDRARVRLDFEVDGVSYTAVRMAQRTATGGASVREARLQKGEAVLADGADDVTTAVEDLLRLSFDDFTRTVVLPQGEFARFLTATKSERQGLLRNLLGLDVYPRMRELARMRAAVATERSEGARRTLDALEVPDAETRGRAVERRDALVRLAEQLPDEEARLTELDRTYEEAQRQEQGLAKAMERLDTIEAPELLDDLESLSTEARSRVVETEEAHDETADLVGQLEGSLAEMPSIEKVQVWKRARHRLVDLEKRLDEEGLDEARQAVSDATSALERGSEKLDRLRGQLQEARSRHSAHVLANELVPGEPCPVCEQVVSELPASGAPPEVEKLEAEEEVAWSEVARLRDLLDRARTEATTIEERRAGLVEQRDELEVELEDSPEVAELVEIEDRLERLSRELAAARDTVKKTEEKRNEALKLLEDLAEASRQVAKRLVTAQLTVADLEPPVSEADDVVVQWKDLLAWRDTTSERLAGERIEARALAADAETAALEARRSFCDQLVAHEVEPTEPYAVQVATSLQAARAVVESHEKAAAASVNLAREIEDSELSAAIANTLANHLKANGFEQWLMAGALVDLVAGANALLTQLADGGYSLHSDDAGTFSIVDHRNADEMRSVSTLSGGETFLVSLALALSLAETLAAKGGSGLESIILDEGFGTLDDESLDTVASVLEELTGRGLMVGVITHVKELAARAPVRYEVTREPGGAKVGLVA